MFSSEGHLWLQGHRFPVIGVAWNHGENLLASSDLYGIVIVWKRAKLQRNIHGDKPQTPWGMMKENSFFFLALFSNYSFSHDISWIFVTFCLPHKQPERSLFVLNFILGLFKGTLEKLKILYNIIYIFSELCGWGICTSSETYSMNKYKSLLIRNVEKGFFFFHI